MRIGHGFDVHAFQEGNGFILGGVRIPFEYSLAAHSDGDVLIHALCDALLGAAGQGDIGQHFPDTDDQYENINSRILLRRVWVLLQNLDLGIENIDITIIAQAPKFADFMPEMQENLCRDLDIEKGQLNIKATTTEHLGFIGREEGIAVQAVCLLQFIREDNIKE